MNNIPDDEIDLMTLRIYLKLFGEDQFVHIQHGLIDPEVIKDPPGLFSVLQRIVKFSDTELDLFIKKVNNLEV